MLTDLSRKRCSYPLVRAFESSKESTRMECIRALKEGDLDFIMSLIEETNAIKHASLLAADYIEKAKAALDGHNLSNVHLLKRVADFVLHRIH